MQVNYQSIEAAARRLVGVAHDTPMLESEELNRLCGGRILMKAEMLQSVGSFKIRGAWNCLDSATSAELANGVVAWSSGNHAQGVALAASLKGVEACIVMPEDAPRKKLAATKALGASIVSYDRITENRETIAKSIARKKNALLVPSYDHPDVIAGQGTVGLEMAKYCLQQNVVPDIALFSCSGGGLAAGSTIAIKHHFSNCEVFTVEPQGFDDMARSLESGDCQSNSPGASSICDALLAPQPGELTFPILKKRASGGLVVSDSEVRSAIRFCLSSLRVLVEAGGAAALAAVQAGRIDVRGKTVLLPLSGGNIDESQLQSILAETN